MDQQRRFPEHLKTREHIFYLECWGGEGIESDVWFVNNSDETLESVRPSSGGFLTTGDDVVPMTQDPEPVEYRDVKPGEAILIDVYDMIYDGDFVITWGVDLKSRSLGERHFTGDAKKSSVPNVTLYWQPLPEEMRDPENPSELLDPDQTGRAYRLATGRCFLQTVMINRGDLLYGCATKRLKIVGLRLNRNSLRDGAFTEFKFIDYEGREIFRTIDLDRALDFVCALKE